MTTKKRSRRAQARSSTGLASTYVRDGLAWLVHSISRFLDPEQAVAAEASACTGVQVLASRRLGGAWTLDRV